MSNRRAALAHPTDQPEDESHHPARGERGKARVLETHAHADHLSAAPFLQAHTGASIGIGAHIRDVQRIFRRCLR